MNHPEPSSPATLGTSRSRLTLALRLGLLGTLGLAAACGSTKAPSERPETDVSATLVGKPIDLPRSEPFDEIARLEEERSTGDGRLEELTRNEDPRVRLRAVTALSRFPYPAFGEEVTNALVACLEDPETRYRATFAVGQRADPATAGVLAAYLNDPDPEMRKRVVEAASKLGDDDFLRRSVVVAIRDADLGVKMEAALGTARWSREAEDATDVDRALLDALRPYRIAPSESGSVPTQRTAVEAELVWRILYALSRRQSTLGRGAFLEYADSDVPLERLFSMRGLAHLDADDEVVASAAATLSTTKDWRVAHEAVVGLGGFASPAGLEALLEAVEHSSSHVRASAQTALARFPGEKKKVLPKVQRGLSDVSMAVRNAALASYVQLVVDSDVLELLEEHAVDPDPMVRLGVTAAAAHLEPAQGLAFLRRLAGDENNLVATSAITSMGTLLQAHPDGEIRVLLHELLSDPDNGRRSAAVDALSNAPRASDVPYLEQAFATSTGDVSEEIATAVLEVLGNLPDDAAARDFVRRALVDRRPWVRTTADRILRNEFQLELGMTEVPPMPERPKVPLAGRDFPAWPTNPVVEIETGRGRMTFELFPLETPVHVYNLLTLGERGAYDGTTFHRVVPDFVIQGGDYRGDGYGGRSWSGQPLRGEFTRRKFVRGSLGMPRSADPDSGASQLFVTHRPTPHLDGKYTVFGQLLTGGDVLDRIERGDRILGVRLLSPRGTDAP